MFDLTNHCKEEVKFHRPIMPYTGDDVPLYWLHTHGIVIPVMNIGIEKKEKSLNMRREK